MGIVRATGVLTRQSKTTHYPAWDQTDHWPRQSCSCPGLCTGAQAAKFTYNDDNSNINEPYIEP